MDAPGERIQSFSENKFAAGRMITTGFRPIGMTTRSSKWGKNMNATKRSALFGLVLCSLLVAATGCRTRVVHSHARTVYVPAPPPVVHVPPAPAPPPVVVTAPEPAPVVVIETANDFYEPLSPYGRWVVVGSYGRCWVPARVEVGWRPYSSGYWRRTDAGWYWCSDEPWGWATYHYGRWDWSVQFGWFWVPQTQWAPAWVCWREGGGYVGWAPLRPSVTVGVSLTSVRYEPAFATRAFVFVEHRRMLEPVRPRAVIANNTTVINKTVNITKIKVVNKTVINEGPRPDVIERISGRKVNQVSAREFRHQEETAMVKRDRNVPTAETRKARTVARTAQPAPAPAALPKAATTIEQPLRAPMPQAAPAKPAMVAPREVKRPARVENIRDKGRSAARPAEINVRPQSRPAPATMPQREIRSAERPATVLTPRPPQPARPVTVQPNREPTRETSISNNSQVRRPERASRPSAVATVPQVRKNEVQNETKRPAVAPGRVSVPPLASPRGQAAVKESPARGGPQAVKQASKGQKKDDKRSKKEATVAATPAQ